mgnify:CR=1 FL=1
MTYQILDHGRVYSTYATREDAAAAIAVLRATRPFGWVGRETPVSATKAVLNHNAARAMTTARADEEDTQYGKTKRWSR